MCTRSANVLAFAKIPLLAIVPVATHVGGVRGLALRAIGAIATIGMLAAPTPATAQRGTLDPVFYLMLEALESHFVVYNDTLNREYREQVRKLRGEHEQQREALDRELRELESAHQATLNGFDVKATALNQRIAETNAETATLAQERHDLGEQTAAQSRVRNLESELLAGVETVQSALLRHRKLGQEAGEAFEALEALARDYREGTGQQAIAIQHHEQAHQTFADREQRALTDLADTHRRTRSDHVAWRSAEIERLAGLRTALTEASRNYQAARQEHDEHHAAVNALVDAYNVQVVALNASATATTDAAKDELKQLEQQIDARRALLEAARAIALERAAELDGPAADWRGAQSAFEVGNTERREHLRELASQLDEAAQNMQAGVEAHRQSTQQDIRAAEREVTSEMARLQARLVQANQKTEREFGPDAHELLQATRDWLSDGRREALYRDDGSARFNRDPLQVGRIYAAVNRASESRHELDVIVAQSDSDASERARLSVRHGELRARAAAIEARKRELLEARAIAIQTMDRQSERWQERDASSISASQREADSLRRFYETRLALSHNEFSAVQWLLLKSLDTTEPAAPVLDDSRELQGVLQREFDNLRAGRVAPWQLEPSPLSGAFSSTGPAPLPATSETWRVLPGLSAETSVTGDGGRTLVANDKRLLLETWYAALREGGLFDSLHDGLSRLPFSLATTKDERFLFGLFERALFAKAVIIEHRTALGELGYQVEILDRFYWINVDGSLSRARRI